MATEKKVSITAVCRQLGYSKQAYYKRSRKQRRKQCNKRAAKAHALNIRKQMPRLGTRKLYYLLKEVFDKEEIGIGRDGLFDLLREEGLLITRKKKYIKTTDSTRWMRQYPNLLGKMPATIAEQVWVADITYIAVSKSYAYLHLITDAYSKKILGYQLSKDLAASSSLQALQMALKNRKAVGPLIHHSDRGLQYCSAIYTKTLLKNNIRISMTQNGSPYDNAVAERVNGILKDEFALDDVFENFDDATKAVKSAIAIYNQQRPHFSNHLLTPCQMHVQNSLIPKQWRKKIMRKRTLTGSFSHDFFTFEPN